MYQRTRVKICGLTRVEDVAAACRAGADAIGLVFYPGSARAVTTAQARMLREAVPAMVDVVALFVNAHANDVQQIIDHVQPDLLQFHGDESPDYCASFKRRYMRAFRVGGPGMESPEDVLAACEPYAAASAWLFDSYSAGYGGSGLRLNIDLLQSVRQSALARPLVLAGGLTAESVGRAVQAVEPYAVDVSSGVEVSPGVKSADKIIAFMAAVRAGATVSQG